MHSSNTPRARLGQSTFAVVLLAAAITSCGKSTTGNDPDPVVPTVAISLVSANLSVPQSGNGNVTVNVTRGGGFTGNVTLAVEGLPAGVTAPNVVVASGATSALVTFTATANATTGATSPIIRATATGVTATTATVALTVTLTAVDQPGFTMALTPTAATIIAGQAGATTVNLTRTGGFVGAVALTSTVPAGITVTPTPASVTTNTASLAIAVAGGTAAGNYNVTVRGNATGQAERTALLAVTVTAAPAGGAGNTTWTFCPTFGVPLWVAAQDGAGAWTRVNGTGNAYSFDITAAKGGIAYLLTEAPGTGLYVFYGTKAELQARGGQLCPAGTGATRTVNATLAGMPTLSQALLGLGSTVATVSAPTTAAQWLNVQPGNVDLIAGLSTLTIGGAGVTFTPSRMLTRRGINPADNASLGSLDFNGAESFVPATATLTLNNSGGEFTAILESYATANNSFATYFIDAGVVGTSRTISGVPGAKQIAGDLHFINVSAVPSLDPNNTATRNVGLLFNVMANKSMTFGPALTIPTVSVLAAAPTARLQASYPVQAEYNRYWTADFQQTTTNRRAQVQMTSGWLAGAGTAALGAPDLSAVTGWNNAWGLVAGTSVHWTVAATGWVQAGGIISTPFVEGAIYTSATKQGDITP
ncbi:MAG: hypothetical protein ABIZ70_13135 [Gemmatimonadales bacterium]